MTNLDVFIKNPFYILEASPVDDRRKLISLADEAKLLSDDNVEEALNQLLHHQRRLDAEINWFPSTAPSQVEQLFAFLKNGSGRRFPDFRTGSTLALLNSCRLLLEGWPVKNTGSALALCRSLAVVDVVILPEQVIEEINRDRSRGAFQPLNDLDDIGYHLDSLRRNIATSLIERFDACKGVDNRELLVKLADLHSEMASPVIEVMVLDYELRNHAAVEEVYNKLLKLVAQLPGYTIETQQQVCVNDILSYLGQWNALTRAGRKIRSAKGIVDDSAKKLYHDVREAAVLLHNNQHKTEQCIRIIHELQNVFWEVPGAQEQLRQDSQALESVVQQRIAAMRKGFGNAG